MVSEDLSLDGQGSASAAAKDPPLDHLAPKSPAAISSRISTSPVTVVAPEATSHSPTPPSLAHEVPPVAASSSSSNTTTSSVTSATSATGSSESVVPIAAAAVAAHASLLEQNGGTKTHDSDMSNHRLLPTGSSHVSVTYSSPAPPSASISMYSSVSSPAPGSIPHGSLPPPPASSAPYHDGGHAPSTIGNRTSLPSMRTIDSLTHQTSNMSNGSSSLHHTPSPTMTATSISSSASTARLYPTILASNYGLSPDTMARYANLPHNAHSLLPRTGKKEIKRRTKTGCLTCRRRRIKCDENRPTCNNCKKSKRDCLGYDPIFRQQLRLVNTFSNTGPHHQQLSYSTAPLTESPRVLLPATPRSPIGLVPPYPGESRPASSSFSSHTTTTNGIHHPPPVPSGLYATAPGPRHEPPHPIHPSGPPTSASISRDSSLPSAIPSAPGIPSPRVLPSATAPWDPSRPPASLQSHDSHFFSVRANKMKVDEIINTLGPPPQSAPQISHSEETFHEITKVYHEMYAGGLSAFFETTWYYFAENGKMSFPRDASLTENMGSFLKVLEGAQPHDHSYMAYSGALETRIVWQLAQTALRAASERTNNSMRVSLPPDGDPIEARNRIQVVEALLSGEYLSSNPLAPPLQDHDTVRARQFDFWYYLGEFVRERPEPYSQPSVRARDDALGRLRHVLDGRENRDVLYSIAVARELAPRFDPNYANTVPQHLDEHDPKNKLAVASRFILDEAQVTGGTTNVVRRICDIAARAFVNPGVNIARRG